MRIPNINGKISWRHISFICLFFSAVLIFSGCSTKKNTQTAPSGNPIIIHNVNHRGVDHGKLLYTIKSPVVEQDAQRIYSYFTKGLSAIIYNDDNNINIEAQVGNMDNRNNVLILNGSVSVSTSDGVGIKTSYLQWSKSQNLLMTQQANININGSTINVAGIQNNGNMHEFNLSQVNVLRNDLSVSTPQAYLDTGMGRAIMTMPLSGTYNQYMISAKSSEYDMRAKIFDMDDINIANKDNSLKLEARSGFINTQDNSSHFTQIIKLGIIDKKNSYDVITDEIMLNPAQSLINSSSAKVVSSNKDSITSKKLDYFYNKKQIIFENNVKVDNSGKNKFILESNKLTVNTQNNDMEAFGSIKVTYKDKVITGNTLKYASSTITISDNVIMISSKGEKLVTKQVIIDTEKDSIKTVGRSKARVVVE